jgi:hypothetical protein
MIPALRALLYAFVSLGMSSSHAAPPAGLDPSLTYSTPALTGDDIKEMLELRASKHRVDFDKPKHVKVVIEVLDQEPKEIALDGPCEYVTIMTYVPDKEGPPNLPKQLYYWLSNKRGTHHSSFFFDGSRAKYTKSGIDTGALTIKASYNSQFTDKPTYQIKVVATDVE